MLGFNSLTSLCKELEEEWNKTPATVEEFLPDWTSGCGNYRCSVEDGEVEHTQTRTHSVDFASLPLSNSGERPLTEVHQDKMCSHFSLGFAT